MSPKSSRPSRRTRAATRSPAGIIEGVDALGVWVRFDEALTSAFIG